MADGTGMRTRLVATASMVAIVACLAGPKTASAACVQTAGSVWSCDGSFDFTLDPNAAKPPTGARLEISPDAVGRIANSRIERVNGYPFSVGPGILVAPRSDVVVENTTIVAHDSDSGIRIEPNSSVSLTGTTNVSTVFDGTVFDDQAAVFGYRARSISVGRDAKVSAVVQPGSFPGIDLGLAYGAIVAVDGAAISVDGSVVSEIDDGSGIGLIDRWSDRLSSIDVNAGGKATSSGTGSDAVLVQRSSMSSGSADVDVAGQVSAYGTNSHGIHVMDAGKADYIGTIGVSGVASASGSGGDAIRVVSASATSDQTKTVAIDVAPGGRVTSARGDAILLSAYDASALVAPARVDPSSAVSAAAVQAPGLKARIDVAQGSMVDGANAAIRESVLSEYVEQGLTPLAIETELTIAGRIESTSRATVQLSTGNDVVNLTPTGSVSGTVDAGADFDVLNLEGEAGTSGNLDLASQFYGFTGFEEMRKRGKGTWTIEGLDASDWNVPTFAEDGTLYVNSANPDMPLTGYAASTIAGVGSVGSLKTFGKVAPGSAPDEIGMLTVAGNAEFADGSVYQVDLAANGAGDVVRAGSATIGRSAIEVSALDPWQSYADGRRYVVVDTENGVSGRFSSVRNPSAYLAFEADYADADQVALVTKIGGTTPPVDPDPKPPVDPADPKPPVDPTDPKPPVIVDPQPPVVDPKPPVDPRPPVDPVSPIEPTAPGGPGSPTDPVAPRPPVLPRPIGAFERSGVTANQIAAASGLDRLDQTAGSDSVYAYNQILFSPTFAAGRRAFDQSSGEIHASVQSGIADMTEIYTQALHRRASVVPGGGFGDGRDAPYQPGVWMSVFGRTMELDGDGNASDFENDAGGIAIGAELSRFDMGPVATTVGVSGGYVAGDMDVAALNSHADVDSGHAGVYAVAEAGPVLASVAGSLGFHSVDVERNIRFGAIDRKAESDYDATTAGVSGEIRYRFDLGDGLVVAPLVAADLTHVSTDGAVESGAGALNLAVNGMDETYGNAGAGVAVGKTFDLGGISLATDVTLAYEHGFGGSTDQVVRFVGGGGNFTVHSPDRSDDRIRTAVDVVMPITEEFVAKARYDGVFSDKTESHGGQASLNFKF